MTDSHYVDNKEFLKAMTEWLVLVNEAKETGEERPPLTNYIAECFMAIAENLSRKGNFLRRIEKEKKQLYIKYKVAEENDTDGTLHKWFKENYFEKDDQKEAMKEHFQLSDTDLKKFSGKKKK